MGAEIDYGHVMAAGAHLANAEQFFANLGAIPGALDGTIVGTDKAVTATLNQLVQAVQELITATQRLTDAFKLE